MKETLLLREHVRANLVINGNLSFAKAKNNVSHVGASALKANVKRKTKKKKKKRKRK